MTTCPDCKGTGKIELLTSIRDCESCRVICQIIPDCELGQSYFTNDTLHIYDGQKWIVFSTDIDKVKSEMPSETREAYEAMEKMTHHRRKVMNPQQLMWIQEDIEFWRQVNELASAKG